MEPDSPDVADLVQPKREILRLNRTFALPDDPAPSERLRAVLPNSSKHAQRLYEQAFRSGRHR